MKSLQSIELFSGAGGLALGLHEAGFRHQAVYEWNRFAVDTLQFNQSQGHKALKGCAIHRADVREVDFSQYQGVDLVAGGPPCQPFSTEKDARHTVVIDPTSLNCFSRLIPVTTAILPS